MLTRCTSCNTWFRVRQSQIHAAHGEVRCGTCGARFNALATLCEALPTDAFENPMGRADSANAAGQSEFGLAVPDSRSELAATEVAPPEEPGPIAPPPPPDSSGASDAVAVPPEPEAPPMEEADDAIETMDNTPPVLHTNEDVSPPQETALGGIGRVFRRVPTWGWWTAGSIVLLLILLAQLVVYEHAALRANPTTRGAVETVYRALGHPLPPRHDLEALAISNAQVAAPPNQPGTLVVTGTLANQANFPQGWPLLRVTLTDRFGATVKQAFYKAKTYLPRAPQNGDLLGTGRLQKVRLRITDPGSKAVGFVIVPCLSGKNGPVCADDNSD